MSVKGQNDLFLPSRVHIPPLPSLSSDIAIDQILDFPNGESSHRNSVASSITIPDGLFVRFLRLFHRRKSPRKQAFASAV
ncbi:hypothetical protein QCA50_020298 [Cerrena zonata]|uniref:Uncharacterized protein n=1 Tax=Cerrena zonata TaxID=2478898 RepID=A0AAW0FHQ3_9APHY